ncbi:hypothetical protein [Fusobacterium sp. PH5-44]|uniref:hypothetical protein n=1 Tax=unclassified Fusobacterium TaxID=2648384 RepID=UPI003D1E7C54
MPKIYIIWFPIVAVVMIGYSIYINKKAKKMRDNLNTDDLYSEFINENYPHLSGLKFVAASFSEELGDTAKNIAKLGAKKLAFGVIGVKYRETQEGPVHALLAYDNNKTVVIPVYPDAVNGKLYSDEETTPFEIKDSALSEIKLSDNGLVVFKDKDGEKIVFKVTEKDFFLKDQSSQKSQFIRRINELQGKLS